MLQAWKVVLLCFALVSVFSVGQVSAGFNYTLNGNQYYATAVQLWYEGYWKEVGWVNGTLSRWAEGENVAGTLAIVETPPNWLDVERLMRKVAAQKPLAMLWVGGAFRTPGATMYLMCDGLDRKSIDVPVAEVSSSHDWLQIPDGTYLEVFFEENQWKTTMDTHWQVIVGAVLCFWAFCNVVFGSYRIYQFWASTVNFTLFSIGPLCLLLEVLGSAIRVVITIVDPFWSARLIPAGVNLGLVTMNLPFTYASALLLTFFWAETLSRTSTQAVPFISKYKKTSIAAVCGLFIVEMITTGLRLTTFKGGAYIILSYIDGAFYVILLVALTVSFLICAFGIWKRLLEASGSKKNRYLYAKKLTLRFGLSLMGHFVLIAAMFLVVLNGFTVIVFHLSYDIALAALDWISSCQIAALKPHTAAHLTHTNQSGSASIGPQSPRYHTNSSKKSSDADMTELSEEANLPSADAKRYARGEVV